MGKNNNHKPGNSLDEALNSIASIGRAQGLSDDAFLAEARAAYARSGEAFDYTLRFRSVVVRSTDVPKIQEIARQRVGEALRDVEELAQACAMLTNPDGEEELAEITTGALFKGSTVTG